MCSNEDDGVICAVHMACGVIVIAVISVCKLNNIEENLQLEEK